MILNVNAFKISDCYSFQKLMLEKFVLTFDN
jgi:hypothetical protein